MTAPCSFAPLLCAGLLSAGLVTSCKKNDPIKQAAAADKAAGIATPGVEEIKTIAEEGFIYGLPLVMNYAVMHDFFIDASSPEFKVPFNTIKSEARVFTWQDTTVITPNSDTPYSTIGLDLRAEPIVAPAAEAERVVVPGSTPAVFVACDRCEAAAVARAPLGDGDERCPVNGGTRVGVGAG